MKKSQRRPPLTLRCLAPSLSVSFSIIEPPPHNAKALLIGFSADKHILWDRPVAATPAGAATGVLSSGPPAGVESPLPVSVETPQVSSPSRGWGYVCCFPFIVHTGPKIDGMPCPVLCSARVRCPRRRGDFKGKVRAGLTGKVQLRMSCRLELGWEWGSILDNQQPRRQSGQAQLKIPRGADDDESSPTTFVPQSRGESHQTKSRGQI